MTFNPRSCNIIDRWRNEAIRDKALQNAPTILPIPPQAPPVTALNRAEFIRLIRAELRNPELREIILQAIAPDVGEIVAEVVRHPKEANHAS